MSSPLDDIDLAAALSAALHAQRHVPSAVTVDVTDGIVTLEGEVDTRAQREAAESLVRGFNAVGDVINAITVKPNSIASSSLTD
jgi:osmotically-inducible protein OsmY